ncbi:MAG: response regulator [Pseudomonadota bacterium]
MTMNTNKKLKALVVVNEPDRIDVIKQRLSERGIDMTVLTDPEEALGLCREAPPDLAIVQDPLRSMSGTVFLNHLVRISWATGTILIADADEDQVHDRAEGLGILGHMRSPTDGEMLDRLLDKFGAMNVT